MSCGPVKLTHTVNKVPSRDGSSMPQVAPLGPENPRGPHPHTWGLGAGCPRACGISLCAHFSSRMAQSSLLGGYVCRTKGFLRPKLRIPKTSFYHILLIRTFHKASPDSRGGEIVEWSSRGGICVEGLEKKCWWPSLQTVYQSAFCHHSLYPSHMQYTAPTLKTSKNISILPQLSIM